MSAIADKDKAEWEQYVKGTVDEQADVFLKAFVSEFGGNRFEEVLNIASQFKKFVPGGAARTDLEEHLAHQFLEKRGETHTVAALRDYLRLIDVDKNHRLAFIEYALYKYDKTPAAFFTELHNPKRGGGEALRKAIEEYRAVLAKREARETKIAELEAVAASGTGVKAMAAKNQLEQMKAEDALAQNKAEITTAANKRKAEKNAVDPYEEEKKKQEEEKKRKEAEEEAKLAERRAKLAQRAAQFEQK